MKTEGKLLFLGTGGSMGIPVIGCDCSVCQSKDPHNKRQRSSALLTIEGKKILIDCGPDYRYQALQYHIRHLDGVILTHSHYDHACGLDELRIYAMRSKGPIPLLVCPETFDDIKKTFGYLLIENRVDQLKTKFELQILEKQRGETEFLGLKIHYISFEQAGMRVNGFRFGDLAYVSDIRTFDESIFDDLQGLKTLVISALRFTPSPLHFSIDEALAFIERCGAKKAWLIHLSHDVDHQHTNAYLPENVRLAYDGLEIFFNTDLV
jgi:phosphoribosyl 1,2-cyclic phosphate phosphodiesterase